MTDVMDRIRANVTAEDERREQNRRNFPGVSRIFDELSASFGSVKVLHAIENGKEIGKVQEFIGTDVDQLIRLDDMREKRAKGKR